MRVYSWLKVGFVVLSLGVMNGFAEEHRLTKDGVGPIVISTDIEMNGKEAELHASARNDSGEVIAYARFCIQRESEKKGCDFELSKNDWNPGEEMTWRPRKGPARKGIENFRVIVTELRSEVPPAEAGLLRLGENGSFKLNFPAESDRAVQSDRFAVYLSAPVRDGFVDTSKDIQDSIKDISSRLNDTKEIELVNAHEEADVVLTVVARGVGSKAFGERTTVYANYFLNTVTASSMPIIENMYWVSTVMEVGSYKKEFSVGYWNTVRGSFGAWTADARQIADDVKVWIIANATQLKERRAAK
jgi:hypothetical protein